MIRLLSEIGRALLFVSATATIMAWVVLGYFLARSLEATAHGAFELSDMGRLTPDEIIGCIFGGAVGLLIAGSVFGLLATLYDINDNIKRLIDLPPTQPQSWPQIARSGGMSHLGETAPELRIEPRVGGGLVLNRDA